MNSIQGIQSAADNWLKNANSYKGNLWPGPSKENRQKGGEAAGARKKLGKTWLGPEVVKTVAGRLISLSEAVAILCPLRMVMAIGIRALYRYRISPMGQSSKP